MEQCVLLDDFIDKYLNVIKKRLRSHEQIFWRLQRISRAFPGYRLLDIRRKNIAEYIESRLADGIAPASINIEIATFSAAINYANKRWELEAKNPVTGLYFPAAPGRLRYLERDEATLLIQATKRMRVPYLEHFIQLALNTGCRKNELLLMQFKSIDFHRAIITIEGHTTKTGKRRYLPMNQVARRSLEAPQNYRDKNCPESPWVFSQRSGKRVAAPEKSFNKAVALAGIEDFHVHDLRHTFASWLVSEGVELIKVRDLLGHGSIRMTERYAHLAPNRLHDAVAVLDRLQQQPGERGLNQMSMF